MKRQNLRTVSLIVVTFTYLLFGAAIFGYLESEHEVRQREYLELIELIVKRKYNISDDDFTVLTTTVIKSVPHKAGIQWKFPGAFYFATTVVTTIGYGHSTPATMAGRSFCMIYALIGIPLGLVMFQSIGERLNTFVGSALSYAKRCLKARNPEVTQTNLVMVVLVLSTILMTSMAAVFAKYERWDYFDALYYCFITLTTIGFGDYVALQKESALQSKPEYVALSLIFILFGLSVVSSAVNLLVLKFLTLNTEDERRDEQLRYTAAQNPIQLDGDVITSSAGVQNKLDRMRDSDASSNDQQVLVPYLISGHRCSRADANEREEKVKENDNNVTDEELTHWLSEEEEESCADDGCGSSECWQRRANYYHHTHNNNNHHHPDRPSSNRCHLDPSSKTFERATKLHRKQLAESWEKNDNMITSQPMRVYRSRKQPQTSAEWPKRPEEHQSSLEAFTCSCSSGRSVSSAGAIFNPAETLLCACSRCLPQAATLKGSTPENGKQRRPISRLISPQSHLHTSMSTQMLDNSIGVRDKHQGREKKPRPRRKHLHDEEKKKSAMICSASSLSLALHRPQVPAADRRSVARLVCNCCCQHSECVEQALRASIQQQKQSARQNQNQFHRTGKPESGSFDGQGEVSSSCYVERKIGQIGSVAGGSSATLATPTRDRFDEWRTRTRNSD